MNHFLLKFIYPLLYILQEGKFNIAPIEITPIEIFMIEIIIYFL